MENRKDKLTAYIEEERTKEMELKEREITLETKTDLINDIIGPRRAGKTSLMRLEMKRLATKVNKGNIIYINFESRRLWPLTPEYFNDIIKIIYEEDLLKHGKVYLFLDEVQRIEGWEKYVRSIYDEFKGKIKIFLSGSTSKLTKSKLSYLLTGRHLTTIAFPLNFREFLRFKNIDFQKPITEQKEALIRKALKEYLSMGGFPEVVITKNESLIETLFLDIISRDIIPKAKNKEIIEDLAYFLCSNVGKPFTFSRFTKLLKERGLEISVPTLEKYFNLMKESFLFFDLDAFSYSVKQQLRAPKKIYCIDTGFVNFFGFKFSEDLGRVMENLVAIQLYRVVQQHPKMKLFYFKDYQQNEVDFVIKDGLKIEQLIQACHNIDDFETKRREVKSLINASKALRCNNLLVITNDYEAEEKIKGKKIKFVPLWKWLIEV
jgi:predicted AAA+ superfamily ATPase